MLEVFIPLILSTPAYALDPARAVELIIPGVVSAAIVQQPADNPGWVSGDPDVVTEFGIVRAYEAVGLLGHVGKMGGWFDDLAIGDSVELVMGDGRRVGYRVSEIRRYMAVEPNSPVSEFVDQDSGEVLTALEVFKLVYSVPDRLTLQTCIEKDGLSTWGRLFVVCERVVN